jgi:hypothetical protein
VNLKLDERTYRHNVDAERGTIKFVVTERVKDGESTFSVYCFDLRDGRTIDSDNCYVSISHSLKSLAECSDACDATLAELLKQPPPPAEQLEANRQP